MNEEQHRIGMDDERNIVTSDRHEHTLAVAGAVATITLNRPTANNALTRRMLRSLLKTVEEVESDSAVRALVITGAGKGFCAGQALDDAETVSAEGLSDIYAAVTDIYNPLIRKLLTLEKLVIAAVNGAAAGAGFGLALSCDFRIAAQNASFSTAFAKIGLVPDCGVSLLLPRIVGYARALELCVLSPKIDAAAAHAWGLVTRIVPLERVVSEAQALASELAAGPSALGLIKRQLAYTSLGDIVAALTYEAEMQSIAGKTADVREGIAAFIEKRKPVFVGR